MYTSANKWEEVEVNGDSDTGVHEHIPVLLQEVLEGLQCSRGGKFVDCTLGQGGMALQILQADAHNSLVGIDRDEQAIAAAKKRLKRFEDRTQVVHGNFHDLKRHLQSLHVSEVNGIVFDLGVSSAQLSRPERGFSFMLDGPLDMRMDQRDERTAAELLNTLSERELADIIFHYGEERYARRIARAIIQARATQPLRTTSHLASVIYDAVPPVYRRGRIHYATRTFQALRIAVNHELDILDQSFRDAADVLVPGGRLCIISFHSLEDRSAKQTLRALSRGTSPRLALLAKKPIGPSEAERRANPRARSAKLRIAERLSVKGAA